MRGISFFLALSAGLSVMAAPTSVVRDSNPCSQISALYQKHSNANATSTLSLPADVAYQCLQSMPFDSDRAADFITLLTKYMQWQSTVDILKNPPQGYLSPATDLFGGLDQLYTRATNGNFSSQVEFDDAVKSLLQSANDGHLAIELCSQSIFSFQLNNSIVSVSADGLQLPQLYTFHDAGLLQNHSNIVSPIVSINGQSAQAYLHLIAQTQGSQDPDSRYNMLFPSLARGIDSPGAEDGAFTNNGVWPGFEQLALKFANGSAASMTTVAYLTEYVDSFTYQDGKSLWEDQCLPPPSSSTTSSATSSATSTQTPAPSPQPDGYPTPIVREEYNLISGYFLEDQDVEDVAVLLIPSFDAVQTDDEPEQFGRVATEFVQKALSAGKKKLVIDLSGNGGGVLSTGYDLFKLFFPTVPIYSATRLRSHEAMDLIGQALAGLSPDSDIFTQVGVPFTLEDFVSANQSYQYQSWEEVYGPYPELGSNMTAVIALDNFTMMSTDSAPIRGYGPVATNETSSPFAPEDILLVTDGYCASTCTVFAELMKAQGVKSLAFGGRPQNGPMQAIGGVKGSQVAPAELITGWAVAAVETAEESAKTNNPVLTLEQRQLLNETAPLEDPPLNVHYFSVNLRNAYAPGNDVVPVQFVYEAADCRLFYTYDNILHPETSWVAAANAFWGDGQCVLGSKSATWA